MTDKYFLLIFVVLIFAIIVLIGVVSFMTFLFFKFQKDQKTNATTTSETKISKKPLAEVRHCILHEDLAAVAACAVCDEYFCSECLRQHENLYFCSTHLHMFLDGDWREYESIQTSAEDPERGVKYYELKRKLWKEQNIPMVILTHYKIDVTTDTINTFLKVLVRNLDLKSIGNKAPTRGAFDN
jgi:hypothetical protein